MAWCGVVQCGVALCGMRHGGARRCMGKRDGEMERKLWWRMCAACVVVSGSEGMRWWHVLVAGLLRSFVECGSSGMAWVWLNVDMDGSGGSEGEGSRMKGKRKKNLWLDEWKEGHIVMR